MAPGGHTEQAIQDGSGEATVALQTAPVSGLMDTGADRTCISRKLAQSLGLTPIGKIPVSGATGTSAMNQYMIDLLLQFGEQSILLSDHTATEFTTSSPIYEMLIGRDIICRGVFTMDFSGRFSFSI